MGLHLLVEIQANILSFFFKNILQYDDEIHFLPYRYGNKKILTQGPLMSFSAHFNYFSWSSSAVFQQFSQF